MIGDSFNPKLFLQCAENVALHVPAAELFSLLKRSLDLPVQWAAMVRGSTGSQTVVPAGGTVSSADAENVLFVRVTPVEVSFEEAGLVTRDKFQSRADVRLTLRLIPERSELQSFLQTIVGSHRVAQTKGLARHLQPAIRAALAKFAAAHDADALVDGSAAESLSIALCDAVKPLLFTAGMVLDGCTIGQFDSKTLRQVHRREQKAARHRAEHIAARGVQEALERAQSKHLDHLASLLDRLGGLASDSPDVTLPDLIRSFSQHERGELYEALFAAEPVAEHTRWVVVAAGDELLFFAPTHLDEPARRLTISGSAGPIRSIQAVEGSEGRRVLWLGASTGLYRLPIERAEPDLSLLVPGAPPVNGGFNSVAVVGDRVFASHSELGLWEWNVNEPGSPRRRFDSMTRDAKAVRAVQFLGGDLYGAIDDRVIRWKADDATDKPACIYTGSVSTITAVEPTPDGLYVGNGDGDILFFSSGKETRPERIHTGSNRAAESLWLLTSNGVRRLIYSDTSLHIHAKVLGDSFACRYEAGGQTLRRVEVARDLIVATNDLRDRLICWKPASPATPFATVGVSRISRRSIQDVCLVPMA